MAAAPEPAAPAAKAPSVRTERDAPAHNAQSKSERKEPDIARAPASPSTEAAVKEARPPQIGQVEAIREAARGVTLPQRTQPMTLGVAKQPAKANGISASAYAGKIHASIARHRKRVAGASGSATVTFAIGPGGSLRGAVEHKT